MSAPILVNSPSFGRSSADLFGFEGAEELWRSWRAGLTRDPLLTVSEWADRHRMLSSPASAERGHYRVGPYSQQQQLAGLFQAASTARRKGWFRLIFQRPPAGPA